LAEGILVVAAVLIFFGIAFGVFRLILGHTVVDRVAAVDMLTVFSISMIALYAHIANRFTFSSICCAAAFSQAEFWRYVLAVSWRRW
jgi:multicomponent Na+:H+ antiporter subunit F